MSERLPTAELRRRLRETLPALREQFGVLSLELFGSCLHGDDGPESDVDLLVRFDRTPGLIRFVALENHLSDLLGRRVDLVMPDALKPNIGRRVLAEAQPV